MLAKKHESNLARLKVLSSYDVLDTGREQFYDDLTQLTADLLEVPICLISLIDEDRQWFKSEVGLAGMCETPIEQSLCVFAIQHDAFLEIEDTFEDERSRDNPLCQGPQALRFYAGAVLRTLDGWPLGTLCVLDFKPRRLDDQQKRILKVHAKAVMRHLELTRALVEQSRQNRIKPELRIAGPSNPDLYSEMRAKFDALTPRETEVADLILSGSGNLSSKGIARTLDISPRTVDHHRASILRKMDVDSVAEFVARCLKAGIA